MRSPRLHREVPLDAVRFLDKPERGATGFDQQWSYWTDSFTWAAEGREQPVADAALAWLEANMPADRPTGFAWGDARPGNMIFDGFECRAVLDWEMVSLGGHLSDIGWWLFLDRFHSEGYGVPRLEGLGTRDETLAVWADRVGPDRRHRVVRDLRRLQVRGHHDQALPAVRALGDDAGGRRPSHGTRQPRHRRRSPPCSTRLDGQVSIPLQKRNGIAGTSDFRPFQGTKSGSGCSL